MENLFILATSAEAGSIESTVLVFFGTMVAILAIGAGPIAAYAVAGTIMKEGFDKGRKLLSSVGGMFKSAGKGMAKEGIQDTRGAMAARYNPEGRKSTNLMARLAAGAVVPGKRSNLKMAAMGATYKSSRAQSANAVLNALPDSSSVKAAAIAKGGLTPAGIIIPNINPRDRDMSRALVLKAIETGDGKAIHEMFASPNIDHEVMHEEVTRKYPEVKKVSAGIALMSQNKAAWMKAAGHGTYDANGELETGNLSWDTMAAKSAQATGELNASQLGGQDAHTLKLTRYGLKEAPRLATVMLPGLGKDGAAAPLVNTAPGAKDLVSMANVKNVVQELTSPRHAMILQQTAKPAVQDELYAIIGKKSPRPDASTIDITKLHP